MNKRKHFVGLAAALFLLLSSGVFSGLSAQDDEPSPPKQRRLPVTLKMDGGLGNLLTPRAMRNNFYSVGDANVGLHFGLGKSWSVGLNMRYTGFQIRQGAANKNDTIIDGLIYQIRTIHNMFTPGLTVGYNKWVGEYSFFNFRLNAGYSMVRYGKIRASFKDIDKPSTYNYNAFLYEPGISFSSFFEDRVGWSIWLCYTGLSATFKPETVGLNTGEISYVQSELKGNINFISFGLGFIYSFKRVE